MKHLAMLTLGLLAAAVVAGCQTSRSSFPANPTDSGTRYSEFNLPGTDREMQNTDLED